MTRFARHAGGRRCLQRVDRNTADLDAGRYRFAPRRRAGDGAAKDGVAFVGAPTAITSARRGAERRAPPRLAVRPPPPPPPPPPSPPPARGGGAPGALFGTNPIAAP